MLFDAPVAQKFAARMVELGVLVTGFFYPVVPMGQARVRAVVCRSYKEQLQTALAAFISWSSWALFNKHSQQSK